MSVEAELQSLIDDVQSDRAELVKVLDGLYGLDGRKVYSDGEHADRLTAARQLEDLTRDHVERQVGAWQERQASVRKLVYSDPLTELPKADLERMAALRTALKQLRDIAESYTQAGTHRAMIEELEAAINTAKHELIHGEGSGILRLTKDRRVATVPLYHGTKQLSTK